MILRRCPYRPCDIRTAASDALAWLEAKNGGRLPVSFFEVFRLTVRCGLSCRPLRDISCRDGELVETRPGEWTIFYQRRLREEQRIVVVIHELVEWLCITESPQLMLELPGGGIYRYDGGDNPEDVRHLAAQMAERMYQRRMKDRS